MIMKKRKRMLMLTDGNIDNASARIRAIQYIPFFNKQGFKVKHIPRIPQKPSTSIDKYFVFPLLKRYYNLKMILAILFGKWEIIYIQRFFVKEYLLKHLIKKEIPIIYDFDDAIYINERCPGNRLDTINMIRYASKVIISTDYLLAFCVQNGKSAEVINTPVEPDRIRPTVQSPNHLLTIGWIGSPWTSGFLEIVEKPLQRLAKKYTFCFLTIGAKQNYTIEGVNHVARPWSYENENEDLGNMDIGIMPLPDTDYAGMKGGYKLILYMSAGIACIASPVGINKMIIVPGENGFLASSEEEWYEKLELLIKYSAFRTQLGATGRHNAIELYGREVCFKKLLNIIQEL